MSDNVLIKVSRGGELVETRRGHNVWVDRGRAYLARMIALSSVVPEVPEETARLRYVGLGIGGFSQSQPGIANSPPFSVAYPAGADPNATSGSTYRSDFSVNPPISTLERPVRISGGSNPYATAAGTDVWLVDTPSFFVTHLSLTEVTVHAIIDGPGGDVAYGSFTQVPLSEVALFTDEGSTDVNTPFSPLVAYFNFATILFEATTTLEFVWSVKF